MEPCYDWHTRNINLAAALGALMFPLRPQPYHDLRSGRVDTLFEVGAVSVNGVWQRDPLVGKLGKKKLEVEDPLHPLLQGLRAVYNYEMLLGAQKTGQHLRLTGVADSHAAVYVEGQEIPEMVNAKALYKTADLSLCAAVGTLGIPVVKIEDAGGGRRFYYLPVLGHALRFRGQVLQHDVGVLAERSEPGKCFDLKLETTDPAHPMVAAYNACAVRAQLKKALDETGRIIVHRHPRQPLKKMATTTQNPALHVRERVGKHMAS